MGAGPVSAGWIRGTWTGAPAGWIRQPGRRGGRAGSTDGADPANRPRAAGYPDTGFGSEPPGVLRASRVAEDPRPGAVHRGHRPHPPPAEANALAGPGQG
ncbi:hypothetical protein TNCT6_60770 [Streptomyces sp. 6-11-2]|nr:hypothetical protein TNCT6_60770 [Streptomyces sp. 6-11-2]